MSGWSRRFDEPIDAPGARLATLLDAGHFITKLPVPVQRRPEWQAAAEALMLVVESKGPTMLARIGIMRALNHGKQIEPQPRERAAKKYRIIR